MSYNNLENGELNSIYIRLFGTKDKAKEDINLYYKDYTKIAYLLNDEELNFLNKNLYKLNINFSYISQDLLNIGILDKNDQGFLEVPSPILCDIKKGLDFYFKNTNLEYQNKEYAYALVGLIRTFGALNITSIKKLMLNYFSDKNTFDYILKSPYFLRFVKVAQYRGQKYYCSIEFEDKNDLSFTKYQKGVELRLDFSFDELVEIGKHYLITSSGEFYNLSDISLNIEYLLNVTNRADLLLYTGSNNYDLDVIFTNNIKKLSEIEKYMLDDYLRSLPSFIPIGKKTLHWSALEYKDIIEKTNMFYEFASDYYNIKIDKTKLDPLNDLYQKIISDDFRVAKAYLTQKKINNKNELSFFTELSKAKYKEYIVYKETNYGLILYDNDTKQFLACKLPLDNANQKGTIKYFKAKIILMNYHDSILIMASDYLSDLSQEEIEYYESIFNKEDVKYSI